LEKTNREVIKGLKRWDTYVFKKDTMGIAAAIGGNNEHDTRPTNKVIILCGPPGTGKVISFPFALFSFK
jgi:hypothetical protein